MQIIVRGREFLELSTAGDRFFSRKRTTIGRGTPCGCPPLGILASRFRCNCPGSTNFPARNAETRYTIRLNLNAPNTHKCPPTMPGPPTMSTCTRYNRQSQPAARNARDAAATIASCADLPSAAPPTGSVTVPAMPPMPAPLTHGPVSCHEKSAASPIGRPVTRLRCTSRPSFARSRAKTVAKMSQNCPRQNPVTSCQPNILSRGETKFLPQQDQTGQYCAFDTLSIPCPYPISAATQLVLDTLGHFWVHLLSRRAVSWPECATPQTRSWHPPPTV